MNRLLYWVLKEWLANFVQQTVESQQQKLRGFQSYVTQHSIAHNERRVCPHSKN